MEAFETYRPLLFSIAYRMPGSASELAYILRQVAGTLNLAPARGATTYHITSTEITEEM